MEPLLPTATAPEELGRSADVAVLPVGAFEQHGPHLPLATDSIIATAIARRIAETYNLMLLPAITIGCSHEHGGLYAGTVSITAATIYHVINDIADSLERAGITKLVLINGHGGNYVLSNVVHEASVPASTCRNGPLPHQRRLDRRPPRRRHRNQQPRRHARWRTRNEHPLAPERQPSVVERS